MSSTRELTGQAPEQRPDGESWTKVRSKRTWGNRRQSEEVCDREAVHSIAERVRERKPEIATVCARCPEAGVIVAALQLSLLLQWRKRLEAMVAECTSAAPKSHIYLSSRALCPVVITGSSPAGVVKVRKVIVESVDVDFGSAEIVRNNEQAKERVGDEQLSTTAATHEK